MYKLKQDMRTLLYPIMLICRKMSHYKVLFYTYHMKDLSYNLLGSNIDTYITYSTIRQGIARAPHICQRLCTMVEWICTIMRCNGRSISLPLYCFYDLSLMCKIMEHEDEWCLWLFLLELKQHREKLLKDNSTTAEAHQQRTTLSLALQLLLMLKVNQGLRKQAPDQDIAKRSQ